MRLRLADKREPRKKNLNRGEEGKKESESKSGREEREQVVVVEVGQ